ncbi:hypothetical protein R0J92_21835, partial [Tritonibacter sp. SIMBA_163]
MPRHARNPSLSKAKEMLRFALSRIGMAIPTLLIVAVAVFVIVRLIPGDPAALMLGDSADAATLAALR